VSPQRRSANQVSPNSFGAYGFLLAGSVSAHATGVALRAAEWKASSGEMVPMDGSWQAVAASSDVVADGVMHPFEHGSLIGFRAPRRRPARGSFGNLHAPGLPAVFDAPGDRLRCPCHSASFSPTGQLLSHQLPVAPTPLPQLQAREVNGTIEVLGPVEPTKPA
jgi:cytochrome b6-f complex iron-sulfur subunit